MSRGHAWWLTCYAVSIVAMTGLTTTSAHAEQSVPPSPSPSASVSDTTAPSASASGTPTPEQSQGLMDSQDFKPSDTPSESPDKQVNTPPIVARINSDPLTVTPGAHGSPVQTVLVDVGDADGIGSLRAVVLCMYEVEGGDGSCGKPDTTNTMKLTWTQSSNSFALLPDQQTTWSLANSTSTYNTADTADTGITISFRFHVGAVSRSGEWAVAVQAIDQQGGASNIVSQRATVNYYASTSGRSAQNFTGRGSIGSGGTAYAVNVSDGTIIANASSTVTIKLEGPFVSADGSVQAGLMAGGPATPVRPGFVALDCNAGPTFVIARAVRLSTQEQELQGEVGPTGEAGVSENVNSCRLTSGGQLPGVTYVTSVTIGIRQN